MAREVSKDSNSLPVWGGGVFINTVPIICMNQFYYLYGVAEIRISSAIWNNCKNYLVLNKLYQIG